MKNKTIAIIQARLTSTRFPNKILQKIENQTLIQILVNRLLLSKKVDQVIVAIPNNKENRSIKKHGSQGQQKSFLISLKLSQYEFMKKELNLSPLLLLDDIFDKLDDSRVESLISFVKKGKFNQVFITDTSKERSENILQKTQSDYTIFNI